MLVSDKEKTGVPVRKKSDENRREFNRAPFLILEVQGKHSNRIFIAQTENISQGGAFLSSSQKLEVGDRFPIEFVLPDNQTTVRCTSEVVWKKRYDTSGLSSEGLGIRFVDMDPSQKKVLGDWIEEEDQKKEAR